MTPKTLSKLDAYARQQELGAYRALTGVPRPSAQFGQWRYRPIRKAGRVMIPAAITEQDRIITRDRTTTSDDRTT